MINLKKRISLAIKERIMRHYLIPFSRFGVEPGLVEFLRPSGPINYVDVGASSGFFAEAIQRQYGVERGVLIEPQPARCEELRAGFKAPCFSVHQCALSDQETACEMEVLNFDYSSSILSPRRDLVNVSTVLDLGVRERIACRVTTLDILLREACWSGPIDLLKIDVQGAELMVLRGAEKTLSTVRFVLTEISFKPLYEGSAVFSQVYDLLTARGFGLIALKEGFRGHDGELLQGDALFTA